MEPSLGGGGVDLLASAWWLGRWLLGLGQSAKWTGSHCYMGPPLAGRSVVVRCYGCQAAVLGSIGLLKWNITSIASEVPELMFEVEWNQLDMQ